MKAYVLHFMESRAAKDFLRVMANLKGDERKGYVRDMFGHIARRYDLMNRLMTLGQDIRWRRETVRRLGVEPGVRVLDVGAGTGDVSREILRQHPGAHVIACDLTPAMIAIGQKRHGEQPMAWVIADAEHLPFAGQCFQGVVSGFLLRNVSRLDAVLREQARILQDGGRMTGLDTTPPHGLLKPFIAFHLHVIIPLLGRLVAGSADAYTYLPDSTEGFLKAEELAEKMRIAGFKQVGFVRRMLGAVAIHWGKKG